MLPSGSTAEARLSLQRPRRPSDVWAALRALPGVQATPAGRVPTSTLLALLQGSRHAASPRSPKGVWPVALPPSSTSAAARGSDAHDVKKGAFYAKVNAAVRARAGPLPVRVSLTDLRAPAPSPPAAGPRASPCPVPRARARAAGLPTSGGAVGAAWCPVDAPRPRCTRTGHARPPLRPALPSRRSPLSCATRDSRGEGPWFMSDAGPGTEARRRAACGGESARESRAAPANHGARKLGGWASPAASCRPAGPRRRCEADAQAAAWRPRSRRGGPASRPFPRGL